jgi:hypothetical protein
MYFDARLAWHVRALGHGALAKGSMYSVWWAPLRKVAHDVLGVAAATAVSIWGRCWLTTSIRASPLL